jgi:thiol-disulfide isomerase/thioredoxin
VNRAAGLAAAAAVLAGVAGWMAQSLYSRQHATGPDGPVTARAARPPAAAPPSSPEDAAPPAPAQMPERLPDFTLAAVDGKPTPISAWAGKSLLVNFWATWCAPCRREIPLLETLRSDWRAKGFEVIGIAVDHRPEVLDFARRMHIDYPVLIGEQDALDVAAALGFDSPAFPFTVFTDRHGRIVALFVGELHPAQAQLILDAVLQVNSGQLQIGAARSAIIAGLKDRR